MWLSYELELWRGESSGTQRESVQDWMWCWDLIRSGILMVGVWNVWQLATVPGLGLVLPAPGLFGLQSAPVPHIPETAKLDPGFCGVPLWVMLCCFKLLIHLFQL